jgi:hypothetical protein
VLCACGCSNDSEHTSPLDATYIVGARSITLRAGVHAEPAAPASAALNSTRVWGQPTVADLDRDGLDDAVVILVNEPGGSGTFYYVAAAYNDGSHSTGSTALLLGDRIDMRSVTVVNGIVIVSYSDHGRTQAIAYTAQQRVTRRFSGARPGLRELPRDGAG